jgi:hypothetical protein
LRGRLGGAQNASCGVGWAVGDGFDAVFARICVLVVIAVWTARSSRVRLSGGRG